MFVLELLIFFKKVEPSFNIIAFKKKLTIIKKQRKPCLRRMDKPHPMKLMKHFDGQVSEIGN